MDDQRTDREGGQREEIQPMFSDDADFLPDSNHVDVRSGSLAAGVVIGCLLGLFATIVLVAVIAQIAANSPPGDMPSKELFRIACGGIAVIVAGIIVTIRTVVAIGEKSKGRFSLRSLFILVTIICAALGFIAYAISR